MARVRWVAALLLALLVLETAAAGVHVKLRKHVRHRHHRIARKHGFSKALAASAVDSSSSSSGSRDAASVRVSCPAAGEPLANATRPALTTACPLSCSSNNLCIFYPAGFESQCVTTSSRTCFQGESACAFQCVANVVRLSGWLLTLYDENAVVDEVNGWNSKYSDMPAVAVNASVVTQWVGPLTLPDTAAVLSITGNEAANDFGEDGEPDYYYDLKFFPPGKILPFTLPATFFENVQAMEYLRVENIAFPMPENEASTSKLVFPNLVELYLRNTNLTSFPLARASFPALETLDLSANRLSEVTHAEIPDSVTFLNVSVNAITHINNGVLPENLTALDLTDNAIQNFPKGALPKGLQYLYIENNSLTVIPPDIAEMDNLIQLYLTGNNLQTIPEDAIPKETITAFALNNCGLKTVPAVVGSMEQLTALLLNGNDFSRDPDFSVLPVALNELHLDSCQLQALPTDFQYLESLTILTLSRNPKAVADLSSLPTSLESLELRDNDLEAIPEAVQGLSTLFNLYITGNALSRIAPGSLPSSLDQIYFSNASFRSIPGDTLPASLSIISILDSALETVPEDIRAMRNLYEVHITGCQLQSFDVATSLPELDHLDLTNNKLTYFSGRFPVLTFVDLRGNAVEQFDVSSAPLLQTLHLAGNALTSMPTSIFNMPRLLLLNLTGNPIHNFTPDIDQFAFLARIPVIVLDQEMLSTNCDNASITSLRGYSVCVPGSSNTTTMDNVKRPTSKISAGLVLLNVCLAAALAVLLATLWRRRKLQKARLHELDIKTASLEKQQRHQSTASIWADTVLLQNRLDEDLVERKQLLGSGMFGEVWLAIYKNEKFALKTLKATHAAVDRGLIQAFVEEIKLVSTLSHPRVVRFVGVVWTKESDIAMVTEFMAGGDLRSYLDANPKADDGWTRQMVQIALEITEAIVYLHSLDPIVIHRDLKSRNVLLDADMHAKLSDFGISRYKLDDETLTAAVGTVRWVAPEVLAGQRYDESVDIYSLGIILSEIDTHKLPFEDVRDESGTERLTDSAIAGLLLSGSLTSSFSESCPSEIRSLAEQCTSFEPSDRPTGLHVAYELRKMLRVTALVSGGVFRSLSGDEGLDIDTTAREHDSPRDSETLATPSRHISV